MNLKHLLCLVILFLSLSSFAQTKQLSGLLKELKEHPANNEKHLEIINALSLVYANMQYDSGMVNADRAIALAQKLQNNQQLAEAYNNKGYILLRQSSFDPAKEFFNKALTIYSSTNNKNGMADCYSRLAELDHWEGENAEEMKDLIQKALSFYEQTNNTDGIAQCNYLFARWYEFGDLDSTAIFNYTRKAISLFEQSGNQSGKALTLDFVGVVYEIHSDYNHAFQFYNSAIDLNKSTGNLFGLCNDYINISGAYFSTANYSRAIEYALDGLKLGEQLGDIDAQILILGILGDTYNVMQQNEKALQSLDKGYQMALAIGSKKRMAHMLYSLQNIYLEQNNFPKAFESLYQLLAIDIEMNSMMDEAEDYTKLAEAFMKTQQYDSALIHYQHSFAILKEAGENATYANNLLWYGKAIYAASPADLEQAGIDPNQRNALVKENTLKALEVSRDIETQQTQRDALLELSSIYQREGDLSKALNYYQQYVALKDSILNSDNSKMISNLEVQYETDKKEQQITLLNKDKVIQQKEISKQKIMRNSFIGGFAVVLLFAGVFFIQRNKISKERKRSDRLLLNILPSAIAEELKETGHAKARRYEQVTVLFTDFKNFTKASEQLTAEELVSEINYCYSEFDKIISNHSVEKIKTIGDSYMCAGGVPLENKTNPFDTVRAAIAIQQFMVNLKREREKNNDLFLEIRIGVHTGPVVAGIVGIKKFAYDIWGDTVNIASRMESSGEVGHVNISGDTYALVKDSFQCTHRGKLEAKNKGMIDMYFAEEIAVMRS